MTDTDQSRAATQEEIAAVKAKQDADALNRAEEAKRLAAAKDSQNADQIEKLVRNNAASRKDIAEACREMDQLERASRVLTAQKRAIREGLEAKHGINRHGLDFARRWLRLSDEQQRGLDESYRTTRHAMGSPIQATLFEDGEQTEDTEGDATSPLAVVQ